MQLKVIVGNATVVGVSDKVVPAKLMSMILRKHHWFTASTRCISALLIAQHSDP